MRKIIDPNPEKAILQKHSPNIIGRKLDYDHYYHDCYHEEQLIYQHLLHLVQKESPDQMLSRFRSLFIERANYPEPEILLVLDIKNSEFFWSDIPSKSRSPSTTQIFFPERSLMVL